MPTVSELDQNMLFAAEKVEGNLRFLTPQEPGIRVSGLMAYEKERCFNRLTAKYREILKDVNPSLLPLGRHTAGGQISFRSNTRRVWLRVELECAPNLSTMAAGGQCGFDCYVGRTRSELLFLGVARFDVTKSGYLCELIAPSSIQALNADGRGGRPVNEFVINFPLYCHVESLELGIDEDATLEPPSPYEREGSLVLYGTSITQGACASRPGLCYTSILSRKLNLETYNFGFSGNGLGEPEVVEMLAEIENPLLYLLDYDANAGGNGRLEQSLEQMIRRLRSAHPETPVAVASKIPYIFEMLDSEKGAKRERLRRFQRDTARRLNAELGRVFFIDGQELLPADCWEMTTDTLHPTDVGFAYMAEKMLGAFREILNL